MKKLLLLVVVISLFPGEIIALGQSKCNVSSSSQISASSNLTKPFLLNDQLLKDWVDWLNAHDVEHYYNTFPDKDAYSFLKNNIPLLECPDKEIEKIYYFRWWTYRKHVIDTKEVGYVVSEFLPHVGHAGGHDVISCAAGHHFQEGRWLHNDQIVHDYMNFFLNDPQNSGSHRYSWWAATAMMDITAVHPDDAWIIASLDKQIDQYRGWAQYRHGLYGLYAHSDLRDGSEWTAGGRAVTGGSEYIKNVVHVRPNFNSYLYGDALALSQMAHLAGRTDVEKYYAAEAATMKKLIQERLWNQELQFFTILPAQYREDTEPADVRELFGFAPWYFNLPDEGKGYELAWKQLMDPEGFYAPYGPTTCEQRHPYFDIDYHVYDCECQWDGPSWPFQTSLTLTAMANLLNNYDQTVVTKEDYFDILKVYTHSHAFRDVPPADDKSRKAVIKEDLPWIDENLDPFTGNWLARTRLNQGGNERGKDYNHSTYCDLIISGLIGLRPQHGNQWVVNPLIPEGEWDWFCLDNISYHGHILTIVWDKTGEKYHQGKGFAVYVDGVEIARRAGLGYLTGEL